VASVARKGWHRVKSSLADEVIARTEQLQSAREKEILRQLSDVFSELARLSTDVGAVWRAVEEVSTRLDAQATDIATLVDAVNAQIDIEYQSTEILGRLLQSTRARLEVLEQASPSAP
jgi:ABC-type transporter Mla subunit MlaD